MSADTTPSLDDYDEKFLACRDLRHAWQTYGMYLAQGQPKRRVWCMRCKTVRDDDLTGVGTRHSYDYPQGYQLDGRVYAVDVREEVLKRSKVYKDEASMLRALARGSSNGTKRARRAPNVIDLRDSVTERRAVARRRAGVAGR